MLLFVLFSGWVFALPVSAQIQQAQDQADITAQAAGFSGEQDLVVIIGRIINAALGFVGIILLALLIYSGFEYMTAGGDPAKVQSAVGRIRNAIVGLLIILLSFAIVNFILGALTGEGGGGSFVSQWTAPGGGFGAWGNSGALGGGIVEYVYPEPAQRNVPRNTAIVMTFVSAVDPLSFIFGSDPAIQTGDLNDALVHIHPQSLGGQDLQSGEVRVTISEDRRTVILKPNAPLGNATAPVWYEVALDGGSDGIKQEDGSPLFAGNFESGFDWAFEVSTKIDTTPPTVTSVFPFNGGVFPRNSVIQIQFSEPMLPVSIAGTYDPQTPQPFTNIETTDEGSVSLVPGEYRLSNGYQTLAFLTTDFCGTNSCNIDIFCLPANATLRVRVKSATVSDTPPLAAEQGPFGFDGAVDMAGNSLDGGMPADGITDGPPADDYVFAFGTTDEIRLSPPVITAIDPSVLQGEVPVDQPVMITWSEDDFLLAYTVHPNSISLSRRGPQEEDPANATNWWFFPKVAFLDELGNPAGFENPPVRSQVTLRHRPFISSDPPAANQLIWDSLNLYAPHVRESVMNVYQNCFNPATSELIPGSPMSGSPNRCNEQSTSEACDQYMP